MHNPLNSNLIAGIESAPEITLVPAEYVSFSGTTVHIEGYAKDVDGDISGLDYDIDGSGNWISLAAENFNIYQDRTAGFTINVENVTPGQRAFRLRARDAAGHTSIPYKANVNLPALAAPTCVLTRVFYDAGANSYVLAGSFADVNNDAAGIDVSYNQMDWFSTYAFIGNFQTQLPNQPLSNGNHAVYARGYDNSGRSSICGPLSFTISGYGNPPTVGTPTPVVSGLTVTVSGTAADQDNDLSVIEVQFDSDTAATSSATGTGNWSLANSTLAAGTHKVHARAKDANNNVSAWSSWVNFTLTAPVGCFTATNSAHVTAGRATVKYTSLYYAVGSNTYLGSGTTTTSLKLSSPNNWAKVSSCP